MGRERLTLDTVGAVRDEAADGDGAVLAAYTGDVDVDVDADVLGCPRLSRE